MKLLAVTARSATFSTGYGSAYFAPMPFNVKLNGELVREREEHNVFSLFSLMPDTEYELDTGGSKLKFKTESETLFLNVKDFGAAGDGVRNDAPSFSAALWKVSPPLCAKGQSHPPPGGRPPPHPHPSRRA